MASNYIGGGCGPICAAKCGGLGIEAGALDHAAAKTAAGFIEDGKLPRRRRALRLLEGDARAAVVLHVYLRPLRRLAVAQSDLRREGAAAWCAQPVQRAGADLARLEALLLVPLHD